MSDGPWKEVAKRAEALGLKLKLHLEQEADESDDSASPGDTKAVLDNLGDRLQDAFDSVGNASKDPAVRADVKEIGTLFKDALSETFSTVSSEVGDVMKKTAKRGDTDEASSADDGTDGDTPA